MKETLYQNIRRAMHESALRWRRDGRTGVSAQYWLSRAIYWRNEAAKLICSKA